MLSKLKLFTTSKTSQVTVIFTILFGIMMMYFMVISDIGQLTMQKASLDVTVDNSAIGVGTGIVTQAKSMSDQNLAGGTHREIGCGFWSGIWGIIIGVIIIIVVLVICIIITISSFGGGAASFSIGGLLIAGLIGAFVAVGITAGIYLLSFGASSTDIVEGWADSVAGIEDPVDNRRETGLMPMFISAASDTVMVQDDHDFDRDGSVTDTISRAYYNYSMRLQNVISFGDGYAQLSKTPSVQNAFNHLLEAFHDLRGLLYSNEDDNAQESNSIRSFLQSESTDASKPGLWGIFKAMTSTDFFGTADERLRSKLTNINRWKIVRKYYGTGHLGSPLEVYYKYTDTIGNKAIEQIEEEYEPLVKKNEQLKENHEKAVEKYKEDYKKYTDDLAAWNALSEEDKKNTPKPVEPVDPGEYQDIKTTAIMTYIYKNAYEFTNKDLQLKYDSIEAYVLDLISSTGPSLFTKKAFHHYALTGKDLEISWEPTQSGFGNNNSLIFDPDQSLIDVTGSPYAESTEDKLIMLHYTSINWHTGGPVQPLRSVAEIWDANDPHTGTEAPSTMQDLTRDSYMRGVFGVGLAQGNKNAHFSEVGTVCQTLTETNVDQCPDERTINKRRLEEEYKGYSDDYPEGNGSKVYQAQQERDKILCHSCLGTLGGKFSSAGKELEYPNTLTEWIYRIHAEEEEDDEDGGSKMVPLGISLTASLDMYANTDYIFLCAGSECDSEKRLQDIVLEDKFSLLDAYGDGNINNDADINITSMDLDSFEKMIARALKNRYLWIHDEISDIPNSPSYKGNTTYKNYPYSRMTTDFMQEVAALEHWLGGPTDTNVGSGFSQGTSGTYGIFQNGNWSMKGGWPRILNDLKHGVLYEEKALKTLYDGVADLKAKELKTNISGYQAFSADIDRLLGRINTVKGVFTDLTEEDTGAIDVARAKSLELAQELGDIRRRIVDKDHVNGAMSPTNSILEYISSLDVPAADFDIGEVLYVWQDADKYNPEGGQWHIIYGSVQGNEEGAFTDNSKGTYSDYGKVHIPRPKIKDESDRGWGETTVYLWMEPYGKKDSNDTRNFGNWLRLAKFDEPRDVLGLGWTMFSKINTPEAAKEWADLKKELVTYLDKKNSLCPECSRGTVLYSFDETKDLGGKVVSTGGDKTMFNKLYPFMQKYAIWSKSRVVFGKAPGGANKQWFVNIEGVGSDWRMGYDDSSPQALDKKGRK